jgi:hypothetical protein
MMLRSVIFFTRIKRVLPHAISSKEGVRENTAQDFLTAGCFNQEVCKEENRYLYTPIVIVEDCHYSVCCALYIFRSNKPFYGFIAGADLL